MAKKKVVKAKETNVTNNLMSMAEEAYSTPPKALKNATSNKVNNIRLELLKKYGANAVVLGSDMQKCTYGRIKTGSISLDLALGGGVPIGRAMQISGAKSTCKTSMCDHIASNAQKTNVNWIYTERKNEKGREVVTEFPKSLSELTVGYIDVEGTQDDDWMSAIGVDTNNWIYNRSNGLEEATNMAIDMQKNGVNVIFIDSVDSLEPTQHYETEAGESVRMGIKQQQLGEYLRKYTATNNMLERKGELPCTLILLNQLREKIGSYGDPEYSPGGRAIEFYISIDLRLRRGDWITIGTKSDKIIIGQEVRFKTNKNKTYKQQQVGVFDFYFDDTPRVKMAHIDNAKEVVIEGIQWGVIERAGAWFKYKGQNIAQGAENTVDYLMGDKKMFESIKKDLFNLVEKEGA